MEAVFDETTASILYSEDKTHSVNLLYIEKVDDTEFDMERINKEAEIIKSTVRSSCVKCSATSRRIMYQKVGLRGKLICKNCGFTVSDYIAETEGFENVADFWNHIGSMATFS